MLGAFAKIMILKYVIVSLGINMLYKILTF